MQGIWSLTQFYQRSKFGNTILYIEAVVLRHDIQIAADAIIINPIAVLNIENP